MQTRIMCQICFNSFIKTDLYKDKNGDIWDVCWPCGILDRLRFIEKKAKEFLTSVENWYKVEENAGEFDCTKLVFDQCGECPNCLVNKTGVELRKALEDK